MSRIIFYINNAINIKYIYFFNIRKYLKNIETALHKNIKGTETRFELNLKSYFSNFNV